jgi:hypothetical protein
MPHISFHIGRCTAHDHWVVPQLTDRSIAREAKHATNPAGLVVVVDVGRLVLETDRAHRLRLEKSSTSLGLREYFRAR